MGKLSVEGKEPPRRPLYLLSEEDPYTPDQLQALHAAYIGADSRPCPLLFSDTFSVNFPYEGNLEPRNGGFLRL